MGHGEREPTSSGDDEFVCVRLSKAAKIFDGIIRRYFSSACHQQGHVFKEWWQIMGATRWCSGRSFLL